MTADKGQTISRPSCLTVTVTRIFHRFTSLHWLTPDYFRWHFSHSQNTFFRDMKRSRLFVLLFYHIPSRFATNTAVNKPQQNRNSCCRNRNKQRILLPLQDIFIPFGFDMVGEWLGLSKARSNFKGEEKKAILYKIPARPCAGRPLTALALLSLFSGAPKGTKVSKVYRFCYSFVLVPLGNYRETVY